jgi:uncharacterized protein (TIGR02171 family)
MAEKEVIGVSVLYRKVGSFWILFLCVFGLYTGCGSSDVSSTDAESSDSQTPSSSSFDEPVALPESMDGFEKIQASGKYVYVGTEEISAKSNERPQMKVAFTYDFFLGKGEVTCRDFNEAMQAVSKLQVPCASDSLPVADVTYYDAVLYANARSKALGMDTVYTYSKSVIDNDGHCSSLEGLTLRNMALGLRLPTEAEWTLAAQMNWDEKNSWNSGNAENAAHKVCTSGSQARICDMAGNVMEWVNDWLGNFGESQVTNFVGAAEGDGIGQRIVKGGGFRTAPENLKIYSRGDIYAVTSSTHAVYVGFRLAFGPIPNPAWLDNSGKAVSQRIVPLANLVTIRGVTGAYKTKLVFRNEVTGNLAFIDYTVGAPSVVEIEDDIDSYHPDISPDGSRVAFCTGLEGTKANSSVYVRNLDASGSGLVKLDVESAAIPRWRVLPNGDTVIVYVTSAADNKDEASFLAQSTWQVKFSGGKFGIPQKLFDGAYHGGISEDNRLAVSGSSRLRARIVPPGDTGTVQNVVWYGNEQACNASLSKDGSKRTLFLDFAPQIGKDAAGMDYRTHEIVFVADSTGRLIQGMVAPKPYTFDHTEWIYNVTPKTLGGAAIATLTNADGAHTKIVLIDFYANLVIEVVEGEDRWHPALWSNSADNVAYGDLDIDSAGVYCTPDCGEAAMMLRYKLELLWTHKDSANTVMLGSSRMLEGVIPALLSDEFYAINMANVPNLPVTSKYLFENYILPHVKNLKYLVISIDIDLWSYSEHSNYNFFLDDYKKFPGFVYDQNHSYWQGAYPEGLAEMTQATYGSEFYAKYFRDEMGYVRLDGATWEDNPTVDYDSTWMDKHPSTYYESLGHIEEIIEMAADHDIQVLGIIFPQSPNFKKTGGFGKYGLRRSEAPALIEYIAGLTDKYPNFTFMDENKMGDHDYADNMAINKDHLGYPGAVQMTGRIDAALKAMSKK